MSDLTILEASTALLARAFIVVAIITWVVIAGTFLARVIG
ncbi:hypothetical protein SAMN05192561_11226 [Halopenitus malekzadehii]|uniref:Uncharacterized protein n=1 Tax=Halopenitus malekzadehii TaxID=1267564 RepID=A0A1H6JFK8_9EURY|nr:hypothetical protein SAMN05192561_11226 [Halopenitus malekzadehii]